MELRPVFLVTCFVLIFQSTSGLQVVIRNTSTTAAPSPKTTTATSKTSVHLLAPFVPSSEAPTLATTPKPATTKKPAVKPNTSKRPTTVVAVAPPTKHPNQPQISKRIFDTGEKNISAIELPSLEFEIPEEIQTAIDDKHTFFTDLLNQTIISTHRIPNALATLGNFTLIQGVALIAIAGLVIGIGILIGEAWSLKKGDHGDKKGLKGHHQDHHFDFEDEGEGWGWPGEDGDGGKLWRRRIDEESSMGRPVPVTYNNNRGGRLPHQMPHQMYPVPVHPVYSKSNLPVMNYGYSNSGLQPGAAPTLPQRQKKRKNKHRRRKIPKEIRKGAYVLGYNQLG